MTRDEAMRLADEVMSECADAWLTEDTYGCPTQIDLDAVVDRFIRSEPEPPPDIDPEEVRRLLDQDPSGRVLRPPPLEAAAREWLRVREQIDELARFIMAEIPGEPSQSEGAVDTAIRLLRLRVEDAWLALGEALLFKAMRDEERAILGHVRDAEPGKGPLPR